MRNTAIAVVCLVVGCVTPSSTICGDGRVCPDKTVCDEANHLCVLPEQLMTCDGMLDNGDCDIDGDPGGYCSMEVCVPSRCGDGKIRGSERCDSNNLDGRTCAGLGYYVDGPLTCTADCVYDTAACGGGRCGDDIVQIQEFCEDGQTPPRAGCVEYGFDIGTVGCSAACTPGFDRCDNFGFVSVVSGTALALERMWGTSATDIWAVGDSITHFDGESWTAVVPRVAGDERLYGVSGTSSTDVWAVGVNNLVMHWDGTSWSSTHLVKVAIRETLFAVWALAPDDVYAVGNTEGGGQVQHWDGSQWTRTDRSQGLTDVWGSSPTNVYATGDAGSIEHFTGTWQTIVPSGTVGALNGIWGSGPNDVWAVGLNGVLHKTTGGFVDVTNTSPIPLLIAQAVWGAAGRVFIATYAGITITDDAGVTFAQLSDFELTAVWAAAKDEVWALNNVGALKRFTGTGWLDDVSSSPMVRWAAGLANDYVVLGTEARTLQLWNGELFTPLPTTPVPMAAGWVAARDDIFLVGAAGLVVRYDPGIPGWTALGPTMTAEDFNAVWGTSATNVWAVGGSTIAHFTGSWDTITLPGTLSLTGVWGSGPTDVYTVGADLGNGGGVVFRYDGSAWSKVDTGLMLFSAFSVSGTGPDDVFVTANEGIAHYDGMSWELQDTGTSDLITAISAQAPDEVFGAGTNGALVHYDGSSWSLVRMVTQPANCPGVYTGSERVVVACDDGTHVLLRP